MKKTIILLLLIFCTVAYADDCKFSFLIHNNAECEATYRIAWIDHPFEYPYPFEIMVGEIQTDESKISEFKYPLGKYVVSWEIEGETIVHGFIHDSCETKFIAIE